MHPTWFLLLALAGFYWFVASQKEVAPAGEKFLSVSAVGFFLSGAVLAIISLVKYFI